MAETQGQWCTEHMLHEDDRRHLTTDLCDFRPATEVENAAKLPTYTPLPEHLQARSPYAATRTYTVLFSSGQPELVMLKQAITELCESWEGRKPHCNPAAQAAVARRIQVLQAAYELLLEPAPEGIQL